MADDKPTYTKYRSRPKLFSRGGGNGRANRITLCAWHHLRGIHAGRVRAEGEAPDAITWEIGVRAGRRPLLRLAGERYATG